MPASTPTIILPTIHTNGSSKNALLRQYHTAASDVRKAITTIEEIDFNGRDYYPQGDAAFREARAQHEARMNRLVETRKELDLICEHLLDMGATIED